MYTYMDIRRIHTRYRYRRAHPNIVRNDDDARTPEKTITASNAIWVRLSVRRKPNCPK